MLCLRTALQDYIGRSVHACTSWSTYGEDWALARLQVLPLKELDDSTPIQLSALVRLEATDGEKRTLFFGSAGGGEQIDADGEEVEEWMAFEWRG